MGRLPPVCLLLTFCFSVGSESSCLPVLSLLGAVLCPVSFLSADETFISGKWGCQEKPFPRPSPCPSLPGSVKLALLSALSCLCGLDTTDTACIMVSCALWSLLILFLLSFVFGLCWRSACSECSAVSINRAVRRVRKSPTVSPGCCLHPVILDMSILLGKAVLRALRSVLRALTYAALTTSSQSVEVRRRSPPQCWHIFAKSVGLKMRKRWRHHSVLPLPCLHRLGERWVESEMGLIVDGWSLVSAHHVEEGFVVGEEEGRYWGEDCHTLKWRIQRSIAVRHLQIRVPSCQVDSITAVRHLVRGIFITLDTGQWIFPLHKFSIANVDKTELLCNNYLGGNPPNTPPGHFDNVIIFDLAWNRQGCWSPSWQQHY